MADPPLKFIANPRESPKCLQNDLGGLRGPWFFNKKLDFGYHLLLHFSPNSDLEFLLKNIVFFGSIFCIFCLSIPPTTPTCTCLLICLIYAAKVKYLHRSLLEHPAPASSILLNACIEYPAQCVAANLPLDAAASFHNIPSIMEAANIACMLQYIAFDVYMSIPCLQNKLPKCIHLTRCISLWLQRNPSYLGLLLLCCNKQHLCIMEASENAVFRPTS